MVLCKLFLQIEELAHNVHLPVWEIDMPKKGSWNLTARIYKPLDFQFFQLYLLSPQHSYRQMYSMFMDNKEIQELISKYLLSRNLLLKKL
ncbi:unnamed protein product [Blepharisma stoltei]|uniref:Uncharacterized protein n=1 Tax=Blepharisma stoltei TaxID=1481888 RepID=A0AAU9K1T5_9CILI|nr:unnamed protein product [Blepharisma stoltei]